MIRDKEVSHIDELNKDCPPTVGRGIYYIINTRASYHSSSVLKIKKTN